MRRAIAISFVFTVVAAVLATYLVEKKLPLDESYCAFCDAQVIERQKFYEDEVAIALCTYQPTVPGHCLIIPKRHVQRFDQLTDEEAIHINQLVKKIDRAVSQTFQTSAYLLLQKNGGEVGQTVPHLHIHYIPKKKGDYALLSFMWKFFLAPTKKPLEGEALDRYVAQFRDYFASPNF